MGTQKRFKYGLLLVHTHTNFSYIFAVYIGYILNTFHSALNSFMDSQNNEWTSDKLSDILYRSVYVFSNRAEDTDDTLLFWGTFKAEQSGERVLTTLRRLVYHVCCIGNGNGNGSWPEVQRKMRCVK